MLKRVLSSELVLLRIMARYLGEERTIESNITSRQNI